MPQPELQPGDRVIELAALTRSAALLTGAVVSGILAWLTKHSALLCLGLAVAGAVVGGLMGTMMGRLLFPATTGHVAVVTVGRSSWPSTLKAAVPSALLVSALITLGVWTMPIGQRPALIMTALCTGAAIGLGASLLASFS